MISVTKVLRLVGLVDVTHYTIEARDRGRAVHEAIHYHNEGDLDESTLIDERVQARFRSYLKFLDEVDFKAVESELELIDEGLGLIGHPDLIGQLNGGMCVVDAKPMGAEPWHGLQLAGYAKLAQRAGYPYMPRFNLYLGENHNYKLVPRTNLRDWPVFRAALSVAQFKEAECH